MEVTRKHIKADKKIINFLRREADKKKERHQEYVEKFKKAEFITH